MTEIDFTFDFIQVASEQLFVGNINLQSVSTSKIDVIEICLANTALGCFFYNSKNVCDQHDRIRISHEGFKIPSTFYLQNSI